MKVVHIITGLGVGGAETSLARLAPRLARRGVVQQVVSLLPPGPLAAPLEAAGVPVASLHLRRGAPSPAALWRLVRLLRRENPDVVQTWLYHADLLGLVAAGLARRGQVVWNIRCADMDLSRYARTTAWTVAACARLSGRPAAVVTNSGRAAWYHTHKLGYHPRRVEVIPNGFDGEVFRPESPPTSPPSHSSEHSPEHLPQQSSDLPQNQFINPSLESSLKQAPEGHVEHAQDGGLAPGARRRREAWGIGPEAFVIGMAARFDPMKGHDVLAQALGRLGPESGVVCVLCGEGMEASNAELVALLDSAGASAMVRLVGRQEDMPGFYTALDVAVTASHTESFPNAVGEAMACGVPCVVTDVGDAAEIVAETGLVVAPGAPEDLARAIRAMRDMPRQDRQRRGAVARERVLLCYGVDVMTEKYMRLYQSLVAPEG
ncbi:glycosyltransferase [Desulfobaculum sp. SPO524]|uniref:glycosyltransferase n=1 Tax=Desulfobaculum sp. SPO524 TaxID=3378071 RepID=UPI0038552F91